jgi:hypothetical protein
MTPLGKAKAKYVAEIDEEELAVRLAEAALGIKRPPGKSLGECLDSLPADWGDAFHRAARAAMTYWAQCIDAANRPT